MKDKGENDKSGESCGTVGGGGDPRRRGGEVGHITTRKGLKWVVVKRMEPSLYQEGDLDSQRSVA